MSITSNANKNNLLFKIDKSSRLQLFEEWQSKIQKTFELSQFEENFDYSKLYNFYHAFIDILEGQKSYRHFQILDSLIPELLQKNFNEQNFLSIISELRNLIIHKIISNIYSIEGYRELQIPVILNYFDDLFSFIRRNYTLHSQLQNEGSNFLFKEFTRNTPIGIFFIFGPRIGSKSLINQYIAQLCGTHPDAFLKEDFWHSLINNHELRKLESLLKEIYQNKKRRYSFRYSLKLRDDKFHPVFEEGYIDYDSAGNPAAISGYLVPQREHPLNNYYESQKFSDFPKILSISSLPGLICDLEGKITVCNTSLLKQFNFKNEVFVGSNLIEWIDRKKESGKTTFDGLVKKILSEKRVYVDIINSKKETFQTELQCLRLDGLDKEAGYLFFLNIIDKNFSCPPEECDFFQRLKFLVEIQKEMMIEDDIYSTFQKILEYGLELFPFVDSGYLLTVHQNGCSYVSTKGYDLKKLMGITLFPSDLHDIKDTKTRIREIFHESPVCEILDIQKFICNHMTNQDYKQLSKVGRLDEISSTLWGLIRKNGNPFAVIVLDNYKIAQTFTENDKNLLELYLYQIGNFLKNTNSLNENQFPITALEKIFGNSPLATFVEQKNQFKYVNRKFKYLTGYSPEEFAHLSIWDLVEPNYSSEIKKHVRQNLSKKKPASEYELKIVHKDGNTINCIIYFSLVEVEGESALLGEITDITEKKFLETRFRQTEKMDTIGILIAGVAHDFNNILGAIYSSVQMIMLDPKHPKTTQRAETIYKMAQRANQLTKELFSFSRADEQNFSVFQLNTLIKNSLQLIERSLDANIKLSLDLSPDLKTILGNQNQFVQILMNLTTNARDSMPKGGIMHIKTRNYQVDESHIQKNPEFNPGLYVCLIVEDSGHGISEEIKDKIFNPFFTTKNKDKGTGLGLSMVREVTKNHKGIILLHSEVDKGTTFKLYFPASETPVKQEAPKVAVSAVKGCGTILAIDDEVDLLQTTEAILSHLGYKVFLANSGEEAIQIYKQKRKLIDLVILDYVMPVMDGKETFLKLKEINPDIKVILCTGYAEKNGLEEVQQMGVLGIISKPYSIETLSRKLKDLYK